jgi:enamine deaminase RidA (YjgF/YER057c/UK114 family)
MGSFVRHLDPPHAPPKAGLYSHVTIAEPGRLAFVAGQVSVSSSGEVVGAGDFAAQTDKVFANLGAILGDLGSGFENVCELTTYIVGAANLDAWFKARTAAYAKIYPSGSYPPNTLLVIERLVRPEFMLEISATARVP